MFPLAQFVERFPLVQKHRGCFIRARNFLLFSAEGTGQLVRKDKDVNEHDRLFNFTLRHKLK